MKFAVVAAVPLLQKHVEKAKSKKKLGNGPLEWVLRTDRTVMNVSLSLQLSGLPG